MKKLFLPLYIGVLFVAFTLSSCSVAQTTVETTKTEVTQELLENLIIDNRRYTQEGEVADYIPELGKADPNDMAIAVVTKEGEILEAGDTEKTFTIQSISKLVALMLAVEDRGEEEVFGRMGYFGTNQPFNHYANLETDAKPLNPLMNAGAILTTSMIKGNGAEPYQRILDRIRYITNNETIEINNSVYHSEKSTGDRNRGIFYILKNNGGIESEEGNEDQLTNYFKQCSIEVSAKDLAKIGYYFAHQGMRYDRDDRYRNPDLTELILSQMLIAGMYDFSGEYARTVGLPSKSGVGGGIAVSVPGQMGIGTYSPSLDEHGNSVAGYHMILELTTALKLSLFR